MFKLKDEIDVKEEAIPPISSDYQAYEIPGRGVEVPTIMMQCSNKIKEELPDAEIDHKFKIDGSYEKLGNFDAEYSVNVPDVNMFKFENEIDVKEEAVPPISSDYQEAADGEGDALSAAAPPHLQDVEPPEEQRALRPQGSVAAAAAWRSESLFACDACDESFSRKSELQTHINAVHDGVRKFVCDACD